MLSEENEEFLHRRATEERQKMAATSCMVRSVHEELAEEYEQRLDEAAAVTAELKELASKVI